MSGPNPVDLVRSFYSRLAQGDVPGLLELLSAELEWTEAELGRAISYYDRKLNERFLTVTMYVEGAPSRRRT